MLDEGGVGVNVDFAPAEVGLAVELGECVLDDVTEVTVLARVDEDVVHGVNCKWGGVSEISWGAGSETVDLTCDLSLAEGYKSGSQIARVLSEGWFAKNAYCLACDADEVKQTKANTGATDFVCPKCSHRYELKAFKGKRQPKSLNDGAFKEIIGRIKSGEAPTLCLLRRSPEWIIEGLNAIHSSFVLPEAIVARPPLSAKAKRDGWVGCTIRLDRIDSAAQVGVIHDGAVLPVEQVRESFQRFLPLAKKSVETRGWTLLTLGIVRGLRKAEFSLNDVYALENRFAKAYPGNRHVRDKIRQQLQVLRDLGVLEFVGRGEYRIQN